MLQIARTLLFISTAGWGLSATVYLVVRLTIDLPMKIPIAGIGALLLVMLGGAYGLWRGAPWGPVLIATATAPLVALTLALREAFLNSPGPLFGAASLFGVFEHAAGFDCSERSARLMNGARDELRGMGRVALGGSLANPC